MKYNVAAQMLIARGAEIDLMDASGRTALIFAANSGHAEVCEVSHA